MIKEVVLHIGMHKTGTTAIQIGLENYDNGHTRMARLPDVNHSVPIYSLFSESKYNYYVHQSIGRDNKAIDEYNQEALINLENELALSRDKLIISGEDISLLKKQEVKALITFLKKRACKVCVVAYVRAPENFASSALQQYIQGGMRKAVLPTPDYKIRFASFIESAADSVEFVEFSKAKLYKECILQDFCKRFELDSGNFEHPIQNTSVSLECAQLLYCFNQHGLPSSGNPLLSVSRKIFILNLANKINMTKFELPQELVWTKENIEDALWMENASGIKFMPNDVDTIMSINTEIANEKLHELLSTIHYPTLARLQEVVSDIDVEIGKDCRIINLLNFLFSHHYCIHNQYLEGRRSRMHYKIVKQLLKLRILLVNLWNHQEVTEVPNPSLERKK
jgi:hypothetical protein